MLPASFTGVTLMVSALAMLINLSSLTRHLRRSKAYGALSLMTALGASLLNGVAAHIHQSIAQMITVMLWCFMLGWQVYRVDLDT